MREPSGLSRGNTTEGVLAYQTFIVNLLTNPVFIYCWEKTNYVPVP